MISETRSKKEYGPPLLFTIEAILVTSQIENTQFCIFGCKTRCKSCKIADNQLILQIEDLAELTLAKNVLQRVTSMCDGLTLCDHVPRYLNA